MLTQDSMLENSRHKGSAWMHLVICLVLKQLRFRCGGCGPNWLYAQVSKCVEYNNDWRAIWASTACKATISRYRKLILLENDLWRSMKSLPFWEAPVSDCTASWKSLVNFADQPITFLAQILGSHIQVHCVCNLQPTLHSKMHTDLYIFISLVSSLKIDRSQHCYVLHAFQ